MGTLDIDLERRAGCDGVRQEGRGDAQPRAAVDLVTHVIDGERQPMRIDLGRRRDRVEAGLQRLQAFDERLRIGPDAGELLDRRQHVERGGVAVGILALRQCLGLGLALAAHHVGDQLEQHVGRGAQRHLLGQHLLQCPAGDREIFRRVDRLDDGGDQRRIVGGVDAEAVAHRVVEAGARKIEIDMPGRFLRLALVQQSRRQEARLDRRVARVAALGRRLRLRSCRGARLGLGHLLVGIGGAAAHLLDERLQHAGGFLAAGHAEVQPLLGLLHDLVGVGLAGVAALAAILLRHGRHHAPAQRPALGHVHALGHLEGRVVPRRLVVFAARHRIGEGGIGRGGQRRRARALGRQEAGEKAVQPVTLLGREGRALGNIGDEARLAGLRRPLLNGHAARAAGFVPRFERRLVHLGCARAFV